MIQVTRTPFTELSSVLQSDLIARQNQVDSKQIKPDVAWKVFKKEERKELNTALEEDFHKKCAYCETGLDIISADIDHFWPKGSHPKHNDKKGNPGSDLALPDEIARQSGQHGMFVWANLLWSCKTCNGFECKGTHMKWNRGGQTQLLNPCCAKDDPYKYLDFGINLANEIERGRVYPKQGLSKTDHERAAYTIHRLKLSKRDFLVRERVEQIERFLDLVKYLRELGPHQSGPNGKTIGERLLQILSAETKFLAPIRQLLFDPACATPGYDTLYDELKASLPGLDVVLTAWDAFPEKIGRNKL